MVACDLAVAADDATLGLPEAAAGLFPFIALATVRDALPKKVLFDLIYRARLMSAAKRCRCTRSTRPCRARRCSHVPSRSRSKPRAYDPEIVALGRGLFYETRAMRPAEALAEARLALLAALAAADRAGYR